MRPIVVATFPRSGTHLTIDLIRRQFPETNPRIDFFESQEYLYLDIDRLRASHGSPITRSQAENTLCRTKNPIIKTHSLPSFSGFDENADFVHKLVKKSKILYIVRDVRAALASLHCMHDSQMLLGDFIRTSGKDFTGQNHSLVEAWNTHVQAWIDTPNVTIFTFENIIRNPHAAITQIGKKIDLEPRFVNPLLPKKKGRWGGYQRSHKRLSTDMKALRRVTVRDAESPKITTHAFLHVIMNLFARKQYHRSITLDIKLYNFNE